MSASSPIGAEPSPKTRAFVAWTIRHGRLIWIIALLLAIPAAVRTASLYIHLRSELDQLLPQDAPSVAAIQELRQRIPGLHYLGVLVESTDPSRIPDGERLLDDLAAKIRTYPPDLVRTVRTGVAEERDFVRKHATLFMDLADVRTIRARIVARRDYEVTKSIGASLEDGPAPSLDFSDIEEKYKQRVYAFALVSLPPLRITELHSNTAFMGSIIIGNGINTAIILLARHREERRSGANAEEAIARAIWGTRTATLSAALAAGVAYGSLFATQFRGFRQLGAIGGIGMLVCWGAAAREARSADRVH